MHIKSHERKIVQEFPGLFNNESLLFVGSKISPELKTIELHIQFFPKFKLALTLFKWH